MNQRRQVAVILAHAAYLYDEARYEKKNWNWLDAIDISVMQLFKKLITMEYYKVKAVDYLISFYSGKYIIEPFSVQGAETILKIHSVNPGEPTCQMLWDAAVFFNGNDDFGKVSERW